jgi:ATP-dependent protease ClpP protease subunit
MKKVTVPLTADEFIEQQLSKHLEELEQLLKSNLLVFVGDLGGDVDDVIKNVVEEKRQNSKKNDKLTMIVKTPGGYIETVQRIVETLRHHYKIIDFIIPNYAFSAGTVLAMSGDALLFSTRTNRSSIRNT